jgi:hypothetical protein
MVMNMRPIQFLVFVIFILASSTQASAVDIPVRIVNKSAMIISPGAVVVNDKRGHTSQGTCSFCISCLSRVVHVSPNDDVRCELDGREKKQRSLEVTFNCGTDNSADDYISQKTVVFPRARGWFGRKHLKNNNNIYTLTIKESDCQ